MRGKEFGCHFLKTEDGITPAYAGKSRDSGVVVAVVRDHPRLCGEKLDQIFIIGNVIRITPAYAGKSFHPRNMKRI